MCLCQIDKVFSFQSVAEFLDQYYSPDDLEMFFKFMGLPNQPVNVIGPNDPSNPGEGLCTFALPVHFNTHPSNFPIGGEASLDIQYIMGLAPNVSTTFWSLPGLHDGQEPFDEWITQVLNSPNGDFALCIRPPL